MKNALFIIPYFGTLPNTMPVFLQTCRYNPDFDWLIVTDDRTEYEYPGNVHVQYSSFENFAARVQSCFDFPTALRYPYKICDFRAAFGVIFAEECKEYRFWGHCDLDQYFGKINHFITEEILDSYDKILCLGHFTLFRNTERINKLFMITDKKRDQSYRDVFADEKHWIYDEWPTDGRSCVNRIVKQEGVPVYYCHDCFCDLIPFVSRYQRYIFDEKREDWDIEPVKNMIFVWEKGCLYACHKEDGQLIKREMLYVHIRQRKMDIVTYDEQKNVFYIVPNKIISDNTATDSVIEGHIARTWHRSLRYPDEVARKITILNGYWRAIKKRIRFKKG